MSNLEKRKKKLSIKNKIMISGVLLGISFLLFIMSRFIDNFANIYYKYIYLTLVNIFARGFSLIPFSVYELVLYGFVTFIFS